MFKSKKKKPKQRVSFSGFEQLPFDELKTHTSPVSLSLTNSRLRTIPEVHNGCSFFSLCSMWKHTLVKLLLNDNALISIPREISLLCNLKQLDVSNNRLESIPADVTKLVKLERLNLSGNRLFDLPRDIGSLRRLKNLLLSRNQLSILPWSIGILPCLRECDVDGNPLTSPPKDICYLGLEHMQAFLQNPLEYNLRYGAQGTLVDHNLNNIALCLDFGEFSESLLNALLDSGVKFDKEVQRLFQPSNLVDFLVSPIGREAFYEFMRADFSLESLLFMDEVVRFEKGKSENCVAEALKVYRRYIADHCEREICFPTFVKDEIANIIRNREEHPELITRDLYRAASYTVAQMLDKDHFRRYLRSMYHITMLKEYFNSVSKPESAAVAIQTGPRTIPELLADTETRNAFCEFLRSEFSVENLLFWEEVDHLKSRKDMRPDEVSARVHEIYKKYISGEGEFEINISGEEKDRLDIEMRQESLTIDVLEEAQQTIEQLLMLDSYKRYRRSEFYRQLAPEKTNEKTKKREATKARDIKVPQVIPSP